MKIKLRLFVALVIMFTSLLGFTISDNTIKTETDTLSMPKKALIISESIKESGIYYTLIDLDNNEMVIVYYFFHNFTGGIKLQTVLRTGIFIDLEKQNKIYINQPFISDENKN